jgi:hypothetical protein
MDSEARKKTTVMLGLRCAQEGRDRDLVTAPSIPNASPPIFDAFGLGGGALQRRDPVALSLLHEALTIVKFGPGAYTIVRTFAPSACRFETVGASSGLRHERPLPANGYTRAVFKH